MNAPALDENTVAASCERTASVGTRMGTVASSSGIDGTGELPKIHAQQKQFMLWQTSQPRVPPIGDTSALRIVGCFETSELAVEAASDMQKAQPEVATFLTRTEEWVFAGSSVENMQNETRCVDLKRRTLELHRYQTKVEHEAFHRRIDEDRKRAEMESCEGGVEETKQGIQDPTEDGEVETEDVAQGQRVHEAERKEEKTGAREEVAPQKETVMSSTSAFAFPRQCEVRMQRFVVLSICPVVGGDDTEFLFYVHAVFDDIKDAKTFTKDGARLRMRDHDVFVACMYEWLNTLNIPQDTSSMDHFYHQPEQEAIMKERHAQPERVKNFATWLEENGEPEMASTIG